MRFRPRVIGAKELLLQVRRASDDKDLLEMVVAKFENPPEDPSRENASYLVSTNQVFEQTGYRITFLGWRPPQQNSGFIKQTPFSPLDHATLQIEEKGGDRVYQLHIQFLSNGEITSELNEYLKLPTQTPP